MPKPMAMVGGRPFLEYLLVSLANEGVTRVVLSTGYMHEVIRAHFGDKFAEVDLVYSVESQRLGTGGGLALASRYLESGPTFMLNGDSFLAASVEALFTHWQKHTASCGIYVRSVPSVESFGSCTIEDGKLVKFEEKSAKGSGLVNAGVYVATEDFLRALPANRPFSFESETLSSGRHKISALETDAPFIDIGVPERFHMAQTLMPQLVPIGGGNAG